MSVERELQEGLRTLVSSGQKVFPARVKTVDAAKGFCSVLADQIEYTEVRLSASLEDGAKNRCYILPEKDSWVLVGTIENDIHRLYIHSYSEVESLKVCIENTQMTISEDGFKIERNGKNLMEVLGEMIDELNKIVVVQGTTINVAAMNNIKEDFKTILKCV